VTATSIGKLAEDAASEYLLTLGYQILARNWRTRRCEIDIVAKKSGTVYFVEVKYRASASQGGGLASITNAKLQQMRVGAETWVAENNWTASYQLAAIEVSGADFAVAQFIENVF
jgi:uncharacterized protein (TIGR00252 family)